MTGRPTVPQGSRRAAAAPAPTFERQVRHRLGTGPAGIPVRRLGSASYIALVETTEISVRDDGDSLIYFDRNFHRVPRVWKAAVGQ